VDTQILERMGLSPKEVAVYLSALRLGPATVSRISEQSQVDRTLCYSLLNKLVDRGYVSFFTEGSVKQFLASDPEKLVTDLSDQQEELSRLVPQLQKIAGKKPASFAIEIYKGKDGVRHAFNDYMAHPETAFLFGDMTDFQTVAPIHLQKYFLCLKRNNLHEYLIFPEGQDPGTHPTRSHMLPLPKSLFAPSVIWVYGDTTATMMWGDPITTVILRNKAVAENYRAYFKSLWKTSSGKDLRFASPKSVVSTSKKKQ